MAEGSKFAKSLRSPIQWVSATSIMLVLAIIAIAPINGRLESPKASPFMQTARSINLLLFSYANDNNGMYPTGKSSTEVFQKLIDGGYVTDPTIFYIDMPGKTKPTTNKLKPENVSFDVTIPVTDKDSDLVPMVFLTGYKINYLPGGSAVPINASISNQYRGIAVGYKSNSVTYMKNDGLPDGIVPNFIDPNFHPAGKTFQQLTPDGPLSP